MTKSTETDSSSRPRGLRAWVRASPWRALLLGVAFGLAYQSFILVLALIEHVRTSGPLLVTLMMAGFLVVTPYVEAFTSLQDARPRTAGRAASEAGTALGIMALLPLWPAVAVYEAWVVPFSIGVYAFAALLSVWRWRAAIAAAVACENSSNGPDRVTIR